MKTILRMTKITNVT